MDCNINRLRWALDDHPSFDPLSAKLSPRGHCCVYNRDFFTQAMFQQPPVQELHVLNPSLVLNELEEVGESHETTPEPIALNSNDNEPTNELPLLTINGARYSPENLPLTDELSSFKKRESLLSRETSQSNVDLAVSPGSPLINTETSVLMSLKRTEVVSPDDTLGEIKCDQSERRMTTFCLNRFNSFSVNSPERPRRKGGRPETQTTARKGKKIRKNRKGDKAQQKPVKPIIKYPLEMSLCSCPSSGCIKSYCKCFSAQNHCSAACKCTNCKNSPHTTSKEFLPNTPDKTEDTNLTLDQSTLNDKQLA